MRRPLEYRFDDSKVWSYGLRADVRMTSSDTRLYAEEPINNRIQAFTPGVAGNSRAWYTDVSGDGLRALLPA